jgi:hypothetical protein
MRSRFLIAAVCGAVLPLSFFVPFLMKYGPDPVLFLKFLFANNVSAFFAMDVLVSSVVLWFFVFSEGRRLGMKHLWVYLLGNLLVGVSLALPLFLFFRSRRLNDIAPHGKEKSVTSRGSGWY